MYATQDMIIQHTTRGDLMKRLVALLFMAAITTLAFSQPEPGLNMGIPIAGPGGHGPWMHGRKELMSALKLTEDQQTQMQKMRIDLQKKQTALQAKIRIARLEMQELFSAANLDRAAIEKKMKEVSELQYQEKLNGLDHLFSVKAILSPEQQKIWKDHIKQAGPEIRERMMDRMMGRRMDRRHERDTEREN
jgi:Spy/CpxP family protein refolding chaperone